MDALGLLCETHRSTEGVSPQEFELLRHFLPPNVNCQPPGVRQLTVSLLKRVRVFTNISLQPRGNLKVTNCVTGPSHSMYTSPFNEVCR